MALEVTAPAYGAPNANDPIGTQQNLGDKDIFLKLLVAQMTYQDPLDPSDSTQMSAQLAQFNMVEQQTATNKWLEQMAANQSGGGSTDSAASYLGKTVTVNQSVVDFNGTVQNFAINIDGNTNQNYVVIADSEGNPVRTYSLGALAAGTHQMSWDGITSTGNQATYGSYSIDVISTDSQGLSVPAIVQRSGVVDSIRISTAGTQLMVGGSPADITDVTEIRL